MTSSFSHAPNTVAASLIRAQEHYQRRVSMARYRRDPALWAKERINVTLWSKQREIAQAVVSNHKVAVKSGHGVGKSFLAAVLVLWWIDTHPGEDVLVVTTAPTHAQVKGVIWEVVRKLHREFKLSGTVSEQAEWKDDQRNIVAFGTKPADSNNAGFTGRHYDYTLALLDEAGGVADQLFTSAEAITTTDTCRILAIGNPVDPNTPFGNIFLGNGGRGLRDWDKHTISALDNPNFTGEAVPAEILNSLTSVNKVNGWRDKWGEDSNEWKIRVAGEFPESSDDNMFPIHLLYKGMETVIVPRDFTRPELGVDIARFGSDSSSCVRYHDGDTSIEKVWRGADSIQSAQIIHEIAVRTNASKVKVDAVGVGAGVVDQLRVLCVNHDYSVWELQGAGMTPDSKKYLNARAWWHANVRDMLHEGRLHMPDSTHNPEATQLFDEMRQIKKRYSTTYGSLQIESKDEMRKRGLKSPDISDAYCYACAPVGEAEDALAGYGIGDTFYTDPYEDDEFASRGYIISPF